VGFPFGVRSKQVVWKARKEERLKGARWGLAMAPLVIVLAVGCGSSQPSASTTASESVAAPTASPSIATAPAPELVGRWQRTTRCPQLVGNLEQAGLGALAPYAWLGQTSSSGQSSFKAGSPTPTQAHPCTGAIDRVHSHFFDADGNFGSLDWKGGQVDDGPYTIVDEHTMKIGDTTFHYQISDGGNTLALSPVLTKTMIDEALSKPKEFSEAGWAVSVAYRGYTWQRVPCEGWC
jgi:hypothetical protein